MTSAANRRARLIQEMGFGPVWTLRNAEPAVALQPAPGAPLESAAVMKQPNASQPEISLREAPDMPTFAAQQNASYSAWHDPAPVLATPVPPAGTTAPSADDIGQMDWQQLKAAVSVCTRCRLCETRTHAVFGAGTPKARWLLVGEGPGYNEDREGEPFIGAAGKLLDNMLAAMQLKRGVNAYITNIVKCRPTDAAGRDRPPTPEESAACLPYLERQIALIQPSVIVALGKTAAVSLLEQAASTPVSQLRGTVHQHANLPLVVTYHPAYLLRKPEDKSKAWRDLCLAMTTYASTTTAD